MNSVTAKRFDEARRCTERVNADYRPLLRSQLAQRAAFYQLLHEATEQDGIALRDAETQETAYVRATTFEALTESAIQLYDNTDLAQERVDKAVRAAENIPGVSLRVHHFVQTAILFDRLGVADRVVKILTRIAREVLDESNQVNRDMVHALSTKLHLRIGENERATSLFTEVSLSSREDAIRIVESLLLESPHDKQLIHNVIGWIQQNGCQRPRTFPLAATSFFRSGAVEYVGYAMEMGRQLIEATEQGPDQCEGLCSMVKAYAEMGMGNQALRTLEAAISSKAGAIHSRVSKEIRNRAIEKAMAEAYVATGRSEEALNVLGSFSGTAYYDEVIESMIRVCLRLRTTDTAEQLVKRINSWHDRERMKAVVAIEREWLEG